MRGALAIAIATGLVALLSACKEEYSQHGVHVLNPTSDTDDTDPSPAADEPSEGGAAVAMPSGDAGAAEAGGSEAFVSDLAYTVVANGFGPPEKDTSNGEDAAGDGKTITLGGVTFMKGLGVHASSEIDVPLGGQYTRFLADVGVDDEVMANGSVVFRVLVDGQEAFASGAMTGDTAAKKVDVDVTGKQSLKLLVEDGGDGIASDHADWAGARLRK